MNNVLSYYYHLYPTNIHQQNKEFKFQLEGYDYVFSPLNVDAKQLEFLYQVSNQLLQYQMYVSQIVPNVHQQLFTLVHEEPYVLVRFFNRNTESVHFLDLLRFQEQTRLFALKPSSLSKMCAFPLVETSSKFSIITPFSSLSIIIFSLLQCIL